MKVAAPILLACASLVSTSALPSNYSGPSPDLDYDKLLNLQKGFWERFKYPNNVKEMQSINSTIFSENVQGRVSDSRDFLGRELNTEYIFGLFTDTSGGTIIGQPHDYEIQKFTANKNIAAASTLVNFTFPSFNNMSLPVTIDTWLTWNDAGEITQYDAVFKWFGYLITTLMSKVPGDSLQAQQVTTADMIAKSVCSTHAQYCNGTNAQYDSDDDCHNFLTQDIPIGQSWELGRNTLLCRNVHEIMVKYRPDVHCPHIGKTGGGMCDDAQTYQQRVDENYYTNDKWMMSSP